MSGTEWAPRVFAENPESFYRVWRAMVESDRPLSADELREEVGTKRSTVYRALGVIDDAGLLEESTTGEDHPLGPHVNVYGAADLERPGEQ